MCAHISQAATRRSHLLRGRIPIGRRIEAFSWVIALSAMAAVGCGNSSTPSPTASGGSGDEQSGGSNASAGKTNAAGGDAGAGDTPSGDCPTGSFTLQFSPVYSAYDGGKHDYQVPVYAPTVPDPTALTWSASDPSMVKIEKDPATGGILITTQKAGTVNIIATDSAGACGSTVLTITKATADDWQAGSDRYHSGTLVTRLPRGGFQMPGSGGAGGTGGGTTGAGGAGTDAQCTSCHGSDATSGPYKTVEHTPYQTGGFSDDELLDIIQNGKVPITGSCAPAKGQTGPSAACFDPTVVSYATWQTFHKWTIGDTPETLVIYLRSLTPVLEQSGTLGGFTPGNGGAGGRGGGRGGAGGGGGRGGRGGTGGTGGTGGGDTSGGTSGGGAGGATGGTGGDTGGTSGGGGISAT